MKDYYPLTDAQKTIMDVINFTIKSKKTADSNVILDFYFQIKDGCDFFALEKTYQFIMENNDALRLFFSKKGLKPFRKSCPGTERSRSRSS